MTRRFSAIANTMHRVFRRGAFLTLLSIPAENAQAVPLTNIITNYPPGTVFAVDNLNFLLRFNASTPGRI